MFRIVWPVKTTLAAMPPMQAASNTAAPGSIQVVAGVETAIRDEDIDAGAAPGLSFRTEV